MKSDRLPEIDDIVLFEFNDGNCSKEPISWKLGKVMNVTGTKVTLKYSIRTRSEQTVVRSLRDISIVYSVGEMLSNTVDHFEKCTKSSDSGDECSRDPSCPSRSQPDLGLSRIRNGLGAEDSGRRDEEVAGEVDGSDEEELLQVQMKRVL